MASKYAAAHASPKGPGDARPTALQIIKDEGLEGKLKGKVFLVTGSSSGIGIETARAIAATGATVYCSVRDIEKGKKALADFLEPGRVELLYLDLSSLAGIRAGAEDFLSKTAKTPINVFVGNAGVMQIPTLTKTVDGFETQFSTNFIANFVLFNLLKPSLLASSTPEFNSRVVIVSSIAHRDGEIIFGDYGFEKTEYTPNSAYAQSKVASIYLANYVDRHFGPKGLHATSLHPGGIFTELTRHLPPEQLEALQTMPALRDAMKSPGQGAATTVWAAVGKEWEGKGGKYLEDVQISKPVEEGWTFVSPGYEKWAYDEEKEERLWADALKLTGFA